MSGKKKVLVAIMDGLGDRGCPEFGGRTPLQATPTPNMDWFVANGSAGLMDVIAPGVRPGSDTAHLSLLGYDSHRVYTGRGPFEAAGIGLVGRRGDVAFRCNFATVDGNMSVTDRRAGRIKEPDTTELVKALSGLSFDGIEALVREGTEHRAALILRGKGLDPNVTDVDPHELAPILESKPKAPPAAATADALNRFVARSHEILSKHPVNVRRRKEGLPEANILLPRGAGSFPDIDPFPEVWGVRAAGVAGVGMIKGVCGVCGLDVVEPPAVCTGGMDSDFGAKMAKALDALGGYDFVLVNFKAPDVCGHDGDAKAKAAVIAKLDKAFGYLRENMPKDLVVAFTADHSTPCGLLDHGGDPVPLCIYSDGVAPDEATTFDEVSVARGRIGRIRGMDLLPICMDLANRSEKFGA
ncbi:MAG: 2,3-bisphosphoglycerate-independent phosphoglycerate mutase [Thermoplasmatales archaeon]|mgnify:CR=1 FL=1|nr:2,3-bisphosphoglycerate-independent phosphoglycerate mutase [Thermoplasmatales archaeon]